ncbi:hypothetical protein MRB53_016460 [Persea americana]|uniref:Uncharacterized protein n=1 Tax=Persea americana TaxID=3435 RepID=A0ACC2M2C0_PERAE|nr:hypothetical protein MRB53_016460 [Persea americana]
MRFPVLSLLFLFIISLSFHNPISAQCLDDQKSLLLTLFDSEDNDLSWTPNTDCCSWEGITCDSSTGHVIGLDLTNQSISGSINSTSLISISSLQSLNLSLNHFNCSIPSGLDSLSNLTHLNLSFSGFTGLVPIEVSRMKSLVSLDLSFLFSLALPSPDFGYLIGNLTGLRELHLDGIQISAPVPEFMVELVNLSSLHLVYCNLSGEFPSNNLSGRVPSSLFMTPSFKTIDLSSNNFQGEIEWLGNLTRLIHLSLSDNDFSGQIHSLSSLAQLESLSFSRNRFHGQISSLANLSQLSYLDLSSNHFSGQFPSLNSTCLLSLDLSSNSFSGRIPSSLFMIPSLRTIQLNHNQFDGQLDEFHNASVALSGIFLSNNKLQGQIPRSVGQLVGLSILDLSWNNFNELQIIDLSSNGFTGIWMVWGPLIFWANGRRWYYKQMDKLLIMAKAWWER